MICEETRSAAREEMWVTPSARSAACRSRHSSPSSGSDSQNSRAPK
jgi:hypothetical protein